MSDAGLAMTAELFVTGAIRAVGFAALAALLGSLALDLLVLPRDAPEVVAVRRRLRRLGVACVAAVALASAGELVARARTMAGGGVADAVAAIPAVLAHTHFGALWIARFALLAAALPLCAIGAPAARSGALIAAAAVALTTSLTGHAADGGDLAVATAVDWLHVLATALWAGGILALATAVSGAARAWPAPLFGAVARRFSRLAGLCLLATVATGAYNACAQVPSLAALWTSVYGRALIAKLALVAGLVALGAANRYLIVARVEPRRRAGPGARAFAMARWALLGAGRIRRRALAGRFATYVAREAALACLVFVATAVLVDSTPARHAGHEAHAGMAEPSSVHVSMEALHASGGVPPGWRLSPPPGDAARGRDVFRRLACFACHRAADFPSPSGVGPDLTGVGRHHPAGYLLESILNPDAVIVSHPGYTTPDGHSIMPDYRHQLTVADLLDLVTYLQTL